MKSLNKRQLSLAVTAALSSTLASGLVFAQEDDVLVEEVLVTGTRITTQDGFGATSPVTVVTAENIQNLGFVNIDQVLTSLPSIETSQNANISNGSTGTASIDLRGIGVNRTLVLVNGRRMTAGGASTQAPDVTQIPTIAVERIDVLTGGASATYGADAVAGVVNFVTRRMDGVEIRAGYSGYRHDNSDGFSQGLLDARGFDYPSGTEGPDGVNNQIDLAMGSDFANGKGNATFYATWREQEELRQEARIYSAGALNAAGTGVGGSANAVNPNFFVAPITADGAGPGGYDYDQEEFLSLTPDGGLVPYDGTNIYNYAPINHFLRPLTQWTAGAFVDYQINDYFTPYAELMYSSTQTRAQIAESGTFFAETYFLGLDDLPDAFAASLAELYPDAGNDFGIYVGKRNAEGGPRSNNFSNDGFRMVVGSKGQINDEWRYDASYTYAQTRQSSTYINDFFAPNITAVLNSDACDNGCPGYSVFTPNGVTADQANGLTGTGILNSQSSTEVINAFVAGELMTLPTANDPIQVVVGYEWRGEDFDRTSDTVFAEGQLLGQGGPTPSLRGGFSVSEFFAEANIPLIDGLIADLAYRYSDYTTVGGQDTYRFGLDWQPVDMARVRAGFNRAVRAPNVSELFAVNNLGLWQGVDPCSTDTPEYTAEQCARTGVTAAQYGNIVASPADQYNQVTGGNVNLDVEEADTITIGLVVDPMENLTISLDYWTIEIENTIATVGSENILRQCAENGNLCDSITRSGSGSLWQGETGFVFNGLQNIGTGVTSGVDVAANYIVDAMGGTFDIKLAGTYLTEWEVEVIPGEVTDCVGLISTECFAKPEWRHTLTARYDSNEWWAVTARWRYFDGVDYDGGLVGSKSAGADTIAQGNLEDGESYLDLNATFRFMGDSELLVGINNILDEAPPLVGGSLASNGNAIAGYYDTLGQYLFAQATFRF